MSCWNNCYTPCYPACYVPWYNQCYNPCNNPCYNPCNSAINCTPTCNPCCNNYTAIIRGATTGGTTVTEVTTVTPVVDSGCCGNNWSGTISNSSGSPGTFTGTIRKTNNCKPTSIVVDVTIGTDSYSTSVTLPVTNSSVSHSSELNSSGNYVHIKKIAVSSECGNITSYYNLTVNQSPSTF